MMKKAQVVLLPTQVSEPTYTEGYIVKCIQEWEPIGEASVPVGTLSISKNDSPFVLEFYEAQHLYFIVNEVPQINDGYITTDTHDLLQCTGIDEYVHSGSTQSPKHLCKKVVATTNANIWDLKGDGMRFTHIGIAKIPIDFTEAYIREQGAITEIMLKYDKFICDQSDPKFEGVGEGYMLNRGYVEYGYYSQLKLRPNGTVIIHPVKQKTYTRDEVKQMLGNYGTDVAMAVINKLPIPYYGDWMDKRYPEV